MGTNAFLYLTFMMSLIYAVEGTSGTGKHTDHHSYRQEKGGHKDHLKYFLNKLKDRHKGAYSDSKHDRSSDSSSDSKHDKSSDSSSDSKHDRSSDSRSDSKDKGHFKYFLDKLKDRHKGAYSDSKHDRRSDSSSDSDKSSERKHDRSSDSQHDNGSGSKHDRSSNSKHDRSSDSWSDSKDKSEKKHSLWDMLEKMKERAKERKDNHPPAPSGYGGDGKTEKGDTDDGCNGNYVYRKCESWGYKYMSCPYNDGTIQKAKMHKQESNTMCKQGENWDYKNNMIWVDKGCRAVFKLCVDDTEDRCEGDYAYRKCESWGYKYLSCPYDDGTIKKAKMHKQESNTVCKKGENWDYKNNMIWVDKGCRAVFKLCVDATDDRCDGDYVYRKCESWGFKYMSCPYNDGTILKAKMHKQESNTECKKSENWDYKNNMIWVDNGCRAVFKICVDDKDAVNGGWASWGEYSTCSVSCGCGIQSRSRTCTNPVPSINGMKCVGSDKEERSCKTQKCPVDGHWSNWSSYGSCSVTCGTGVQYRTRTCSNPAPENNGADCQGPIKEQQNCNTFACPVNGGWSNWSNYGDCSKSCGTGSQSRSRTCTNPQPSNNGLDCVGDADDERSCNTQPCPVNGGWTNWSGYGSCTMTCGTGSQSRHRTCTNPAPSYGGTDCVGKDSEDRDCNTDNCPVDGGWSSWGEYGPCSKTCATGTQSRTRTCTNPEPKYNGTDCIGEDVDERGCNSEPCPIGEECKGKKVIKPCSSWQFKKDTCVFQLGQETIKSVRVEKQVSNTPCKKGVNWGFDKTSVWVDNGCRAEFELCLGVDGGWSTWSEYGTCSESCGGGTQSRRRTCSNPPPSSNGANCVGTKEEHRACNTNPCPVDGVWSMWSDYSTCTQTCGSGSQVRSRTCTNPAPAYNGKYCVGNPNDERSCNDNPCPVDGSWSTWSSYGTCSLSCGGGTQSRTRTCSNPAPANGGAACMGKADEKQSCNTHLCPVDGAWSEWSEYNSCSKTCGGGIKTRSRSCTNPPPSNNGNDCVGEAEEQTVCNSQPCPIDGGWSDWSGYSSCSKSCGPGTKSRTRTCTNPPPSNNGRDCVGNSEDETSCNIVQCPIDGGWSEWADYSECSKSCGGGTQSRSRSCTEPPPAYNGRDCVGDKREDKCCNKNYCPVNGGWTNWSGYGSCTKTCGTGSQSRTRTCTNPAPLYGGTDCDGDAVEDIPCNTGECPIDGGWSSWGEYGPCSKTCATGTQSRTRSCTNPAPKYNGADCIGEDVDERGCNSEPCPIGEECKGKKVIKPCSSWQFKKDTCVFQLGQETIKSVRVEKQVSNTPCRKGVNWGFDKTSVWVDNGCRAEFELCLGVDGGWTPWTDYGSCSKSCGTGHQSRSRSCSNPTPSNNGADCVGNKEEHRSCNIQPCPVNGGWTEWTNYGSCSKSCGSGTQTRSRTCTNPAPANNGAKCAGEDKEERSCNTNPCPVDGGWSTWSSYGTCSVSCEGGTQSRTRTCTNPAPDYGGADCMGKPQEHQSCNEMPCPIDGDWSEWSEYNSCSKTCGGGIKTRSRSCTNPPPSNKGNDCVGEAVEQTVCNSQPCPINGMWSNWSDYSTCSQTCGSGTQKRTRTCSNPPPSNNGLDCVGNGMEQRSCSIKACPVNGGWAEWTSYGACSKTCGGGSQFRNRTCSKPPPSNGGLDCIGDPDDERSCSTDPCPVNGGWTSWSGYGSCTKTCGTGSQSRTRACTNPAPLYGGTDCVGVDKEVIECNTNNCPVDGGWSNWGEYSVCSKTCNTGSQSRTRTCTNPAPKYNGTDCIGEEMEERSCNQDPCPVGEECDGETVLKTCSSLNFKYEKCNFMLGQQTMKGVRVEKQLSKTTCTKYENWGFDKNSVWVDDGCRAEFELCLAVDGGWTPWSDYGSCSKSCGTGHQSRSRSCSNPIPSNNGADCVGNKEEHRSCNTQPCPVDGGWSDWTDYGVCSKTCDKGTQTRSRTCTNPAPANDGKLCPGKDTEERHCNENPCPVDGGWSTWSSYGTCSMSCGGGTQSRTRTCTNPAPANGGADCVGKDKEQQSCNTDPCAVDGAWSEWSEYNSCSKTCGGGIKTRSRSCTNPPPSNKGNDCVGEAVEQTVCNSQPCPTDGNWAEWSEYSPCSKTCGYGKKSRIRTCSNPSPSNNGKDCVGTAKEEICCHKSPCPINGGWTSWSSYGPCSKKCGTGQQYRTRSCSNPPPSNNGTNCAGQDTEERSCNTDACMSSWSPWLPFGPCSKSCDSGTQTRTRVCTRISKSKGEIVPCPGSDTEERECNTFPCPDGGNGIWSPWSPYGPCSKSCGTGTQTRTRVCKRKSISTSPCPGSSKEERECNTFPCPDGNDILKPPYIQPPICQVRPPCCQHGKVTVNLGSTKYRDRPQKVGWLKGVRVGPFGRPRIYPCSRPVRITADFEPITNTSCFGCLEAPYCGRRMLKVDLVLSNAGRHKWMFNVGDSTSNDGYRGDDDHQENDAELQGFYPNITVYPSDRCPKLDRIVHIIDGIAPTVDRVTLYISNEYVRITNNEGLDYKVCSRCLYALDGQADSGPNNPGPNQRIYIGLNRVVKSLYRWGYGVCSATLSWACPWCE